MKSTDKFMLVLVASLSLLLAGCGGGSSTPATTPDPTPQPPDYSGQLLMYHQAAVEATAKADEANMAAVQAGKDATKYKDMLDTTSAGGDTSVAMMNAQMVLDAKDTVGKALMDAEAAKMQAMNAKMAAEAIPDGTAGKARAIAALEAALMAADDAIKAATGIRDGRPLDDAVYAVTGGSTGTPRSIADVVGMDIAESLSPGTTVGRTRGLHDTATTNFDAVTNDDLKYSTDDHQGMTWAQIAGEANVMMMRLGTITADGTHTAGNQELSVASIAGMTASAVAPSGTDFSTSGNTDGAATANSMYMGITGAVFCLGGSGGCKVTDGKLGAGWYFSPGSPMTYYVRNPNRDESVNTPYVEETSYTQYGYWLSLSAGSGTPDDLSDDVWDVNTFATSGGGSTVNLVAGTTANGLADTATYSGKAAGMSVRKTPKTGGGNHIDSGMFTADVTLRASFGATPEVSGTINNFMGSAVGSGWSVRLDAATLGTSANSGTAVASGEDGSWAATAYGNDADARPAGVHGGFSAHFLDGHAAGAYATRKD